MAKGHRAWVVASVLILIGAYAAHRFDVRHFSGGGGSTPIGLTLGGLSAAGVLFAMLKWPSRWLGRDRAGWSRFWLRGHLWVGTLAVPLAWLHAGGFQHGGPLTAATMWVLYAVVLTGWVAVILQAMAPRSAMLPVVEEGSVGRIGGAIETLAERAAAVMTDRGAVAAKPIGSGDSGVAAVLTAAPPVARAEPLEELYTASIKPYLEQDVSGVLADRVRSAQLFRRYRTLVGDPMRDALDELENICDEARRLLDQRRAYRRVQACLLMHVPLSAALVVLVLIHAIGSLRYL
jgi:hypothetical protein